MYMGHSEKGALTWGLQTLRPYIVWSLFLLLPPQYLYLTVLGNPVHTAGCNSLNLRSRGIQLPCFLLSLRETYNATTYNTATQFLDVWPWTQKTNIRLVSVKYILTFEIFLEYFRCNSPPPSPKYENLLDLLSLFISGNRLNFNLFHATIARQTQQGRLFLSIVPQISSLKLLNRLRCSENKNVLFTPPQTSCTPFIHCISYKMWMP
jgi:hypothetical protein